MKQSLKISILQANLFWENVEKNLDYFEILISKISETDIILLPEMFNTAFSPKAVHLAESINGKTVSWMKEIAKQKNCSISGSLMIKEQEKIYNRLIWISKNEEILSYDKRHLFSLSKENEFLSKGKERLILELDGWKICPLICYDLRFPVFSRNTMDYDMLIYLANWPTKRIDAWNTLLKARAIENQCYTIGVNRTGEDANGILFSGNSQIFDAFGSSLFNAEENAKNILQIEIFLDDLMIKRKKMNFLQDRDSFTLQ